MPHDGLKSAQRFCSWLFVVSAFHAMLGMPCAPSPSNPGLPSTSLPHRTGSHTQVPLVRETYANTSLSRTRCVLTIHNLAHQGIIDSGHLQLMGLDARVSHLSRGDIMLHAQGHGQQPSKYSLLKVCLWAGRQVQGRGRREAQHVTCCSVQHWVACMHACI